MTTFPDLIPSQRTYSPGAYPHTAHRVYRGTEARVRHSNAVRDVRVRLFFPALTTAELITVRDHYNARRGRFLPFAVPPALFSGTNAPTDFTPTDYQWRYAAKPSVKDIPVDGDAPSNFHDLTVELELVPPENSIVAGVVLSSRTRLRGGSPLRGAFLEIRTMLAVGAASSPPPPEIDELRLDAITELFPGEASTS
jgi:hypothetical protein